MIPVRLQLKNFLSYGPTLQTISFEEHRLICLSGKNGHGKTALLDALTWVLWGQARKVSGATRPDQGLMHLGQTDMLVTLDFIFNKQKYRVRREFSKKYNKAYLHIDFGTLHPETHQFISMTDKTVRLTQEKIEQILGLDYESFTNSSFLRQGQAHEFSKKSPKDRKDILSRILNLTQYEETRTYALEKFRAQGHKQNHLKTFIEHFDKELEQQKDLKKQANDIEYKQKQTLQAEQTIQKQIIACNQEKETLYKQLQVYDAAQEEQIVATRKEKTLLAQFHEHVADWRMTHKNLIMLAPLESIQQEKEQITNTLLKHQQEIQKMLTNREQLLVYREKEQQLINSIIKNNRIQREQYKLELERVTIRKQLLDQEHQKNINTIMQSEKDLTCKKTALTSLCKKLAPDLLLTDVKEQISIYERRTRFLQKWSIQLQSAKEGLITLDQKKILTEDTKNPSCHLCEQNLSQARKRFLQKKFSQQEALLHHRISRLSKLCKQLQQEILLQKNTIEQVQKVEELQKEENNIKTSIEACKKNQTDMIKKIDEYDQQYKDTIKKLTLFDVQEKENITKNDRYCFLQQEIKNLEQRSKEQRNHVSSLEALTKRLDALNKDIAKHEQQTDIKQQQQQRRHTIHTLRIASKDIKQQIKAYEKKIKTYEPTKKHLESCLEKERLLLKKADNIKQLKEEALQQQARIQTTLQHLEKILLKKKETEKEIEIGKKVMLDNQLIANAFGKDGIQALLIEHILPEVEQEANELLARLTDNQSSIMIESLRDLKKGGTQETLDINISDAHGIRPYELFSGGEAFRIDFALRIAISKLLARRAGTSLQTLIIDEGFGSQDEDGLSRIMSALHTIQDDFEKIIIVSHLPELKNQFPIHVHVQKFPNGSKANIVHNG